MKSEDMIFKGMHIMALKFSKMAAYMSKTLPANNRKFLRRAVDWNKYWSIKTMIIRFQHLVIKLGKRRGIKSKIRHFRQNQEISCDCELSNKKIPECVFRQLLVEKCEPKKKDRWDLNHFISWEKRVKEHIVEFCQLKTQMVTLSCWKGKWTR